MLGHKMIGFGLRRRKFREKVRVMNTLSEPILIGRRFLRKRGFVLNVAGGRATFFQKVGGSLLTNSGRIVASESKGIRDEAVGFVAKVHVKDEITAFEFDSGDTEA